jgi:hypothetical protein
VGEQVAFEPPGVIEVELFQRFAGGEVGCADAAVFAV